MNNNSIITNSPINNTNILNTTITSNIDEPFGFKNNFSSKILKNLQNYFVKIKTKIQENKINEIIAFVYQYLQLYYIL